MTLNNDEIYYLAHPLTTCGPMEENYLSEQLYAKKLKKACPGIRLVRPLKIIPKGYTPSEALRVCVPLLQLSTAIILCGNWPHSDGCTFEKNIAMKTDILIIDYDELNI